jgi:lipopolysaccharide export system protein LptC
MKVAVQRYTAWFPLLLLAALAALTFWLDRELNPAEYHRDGKNRHDVDYIVENFSATRLGPNGTPRYKLNARRMVHYPDDDTTHLESPKLVSFTNYGAVVTVTSKNAMLSSDGENAYLTDDVRLVRSAYAKKSELRVETSYLHVIPDQEIARTDKPVQIADLHIRINSVGLEFNNQARTLKLLSNVRSTYEMPQSPR